MEQQEGEGEGGPHIREREPSSNPELGGHDPACKNLTIPLGTFLFPRLPMKVPL